MKIQLVSLTVLVAVIAADGVAQTAEERGLAIARAARDSQAGFQSFTATGRMTLRDRHGSESTRDFRTKTLEVQGDGDKTLIVFDRPRDIEGTALLTHAHKVGNDDQWLYLPALRRVKRITSAGKTGSFAGSQFSYEDLVAAPIERFDYKWLGDAPCPRIETLVCHVNEQYPRDDDSGYRRQRIWLDTEAYRVFRSEFYDRKNALLKVLVVNGYQLHEQRYWQPTQLVMTNMRTEKSTVMDWTAYDFSVELDDDDFSRRGLERVR
jgi:outer membrane lipoprotein-sorting protein